VRSVLDAIEDLRTRGSQSILQSYEKHAEVRAGDWVSWMAQGQERRARVVGLGSAGELRVQPENGVEQSLFAEEISVKAS
jgi:biotin-(acetyl-CoA carboxylase) ligase